MGAQVASIKSVRYYTNTQVPTRYEWCIFDLQIRFRGKVQIRVRPMAGFHSEIKF